MKKIVIFLLFIAISFPKITEAKIWRVNNNPGVVADFASFDAAMTAHAAGDTIHLEPSSTSYTVSETSIYTNHLQVTIIGNGYFLDQYGNQGLQQNGLLSVLSSASGNFILINSNVKFIGIVFNYPVKLVEYFASPTYYTISNVYFESCLFWDNISTENITYSGAAVSTSGLHFFRNCFRMDASLATGSSLSNFIFENNICFGAVTVGYPSTYDQSVIRNNIFKNGFSCRGAYLANNIFTHPFISFSFNTCVLKNNIFAKPIFQTGSTAEANNQFGVDMATVFQDAYFFSPETASFISEETPAKLAPGSPAIGAGVPNGATPVDCGAFGGPNPYKLSGIPAIPAIYELQVPTLINTGTDMQINVKSRSNN